MAKVPESITSESKRLLIDSFEVVEAVGSLVVYSLDVVFFVDSHSIRYLFGSPGTEDTIGLSKAINAVRFSKDYEMGLRA